MIREFAKHVVAIHAESRGVPVKLAKTDKHTWRAAPCGGPLTVTAEVYAWDLSVRGAHLDTTHGFFNGTAVFLQVPGKEDRPCEVEIVPPPGRRYAPWHVATSLARAGARPFGFGPYIADDYDELIDHPVEMGTFAHATFSAGGVPHEVVITGRQRCDLERLARDLKHVCEQHLRFFGGPPPMHRYVFLVTALGEGYGGLEHRASTALVCSRDDLPQPGVKEATEGYRTFLGLASHEYFHTWNVKRIKPQAFSPYALDRENYTALLWAFEGITSYYDDLALARCGLLAPEQYLETLGRSITQLLRTPGRRRQTVAESSWDAWIKYYRQDENAPNAIVSYYGKGSLVALCADLLIRSRTGGRRSLDDVMRALWRRYGRPGIGVPEDGVERLAEEVTGVRLRTFFDRALRSHRRAAARAPARDGRDRDGGPPSRVGVGPGRSVRGEERRRARARASRWERAPRATATSCGLRTCSTAARRRRRASRRATSSSRSTGCAPRRRPSTRCLRPGGPATRCACTPSGATSCTRSPSGSQRRPRTRASCASRRRRARERCGSGVAG